MRAHGLPRPSSMFSIAKSAKDSIGRVASETREIVRAKAHSLTFAADGAAKQANSSRRTSTPKAQPLGDSSSAAHYVVDEASVKQMNDMGFSNAAARLALAKSRGKLGIACNWLVDEANLSEIEAAEAADIDGIIEWFRARSATVVGSSSEEAPEQSTNCCESPGFKEREPLPSSETRRQSLLSDDGCGLGRFLNRESFPSPRQVPLPGRFSRGTYDSARWSSASSAESRASDISESAEVDRSSEFDRPESVCEDGSRDEAGNVLPAPEQESVVSRSSGQSPQVLLPPDSTCWDWPLSRHEKKTRVQMIERQIFAMDRHTLLKEVDELRKSSRTSSSSSTNHSTRLSA